MDDILTDVNESWPEDGVQHPTGMQQYVGFSGFRVHMPIYFQCRFKGSDDYLRTKVGLSPFAFS